jgi:outer membrane protein assembly factor BamB
VRRVLVLLALTSCRPGTLVNTEAGWSVSPRALALPTARLGETSAGTLVVLNSGQAAVKLSLETDAPFSAPAALALPGGEARALTVTFAPGRVGDFSGTLHVAGDGTSVDVALSAHAGPAALCVHDGDDCSSACLEAATCSGGACLGTPRDCSDSNACTLDSCAEAGGCSHAPLQCPAPADPCLIATCDPVSGCGSASAPDGTSCGDSDCTQSHVCISGACVARPTPDGAPCGSASACQAAGTCRASVCVRPAATPLAPEWATATTARIEFAGNLDTQGNVYLLECTASSCELVSRSAGGVERFRTPTAVYDALAPVSDFIVAGTLVVLADPGSDLVAAYDTGDGHPVWERHVQAELAATYVSASCPNPVLYAVETWPLLSDGAGHLAAGVYVYPKDTPGCPSFYKDTWILSLDTQTGATRWKTSERSIGSNNMTAAFDEAGNLYAAIDRGNLPIVLSLDPSGARRWTYQDVAAVGLRVTAEYQGVVALDDDGRGVRLLDATTGLSRSLSMPVNTLVGTIMSGQPLKLFTFTYSSTAPWISLLQGDLVTGQFSTQLVVDLLGENAAGGTSPLLTSRQTLLTTLRANGAWRLEELSLDGRALTDCELPQAVTYQQASARGGHWVALQMSGTSGGQQLVSFAIPGLEPAPSGWVTARGKVTQEGRPR